MAGHYLAADEENSPPASLIDRAWQVAYWAGFRVARLWWWLRRPPYEGTVVAVWLDGRVLVVRQSYRGSPTWPGGGIHLGETPAQAASRELTEEIGLSVRAEDLALAGEVKMLLDFRRDHVRIFELHLREAPALRIDRREIVAARFVDPATLLAERNLPPFVRIYLTSILTGGTLPQSTAGVL
jgi:8-oxo-dGTP diphosphatase